MRRTAQITEYLSPNLREKGGHIMLDKAYSPTTIHQFL